LSPFAIRVFCFRAHDDPPNQIMSWLSPFQITIQDALGRNLTDKNFQSHNTFSRFGSKGDLIQAVLKYCDSHDVDTHVIDICKEAAVNFKAKPRQRKNVHTENIESGFVYLMKSGKYFKTGKSNCAERREYELRILLPEKLELIHKIKTDDPFGIENYWKKRFKDKHKNGEWYDLSPSDVKAFKRRKTM